MHTFNERGNEKRRERQRNKDLKEGERERGIGGKERDYEKLRERAIRKGKRERGKVKNKKWEGITL